MDFFSSAEFAYFDQLGMALRIWFLILNLNQSWTYTRSEPMEIILNLNQGFEWF